MVALSIATRGGFVAFLVLSGAVAGCLGGDDSEDDRQAVPSGEFLELKERSLDLPSAPTGEFGGGCFRGEDMAVGAISLPGIPGEAALGPWPGQAELERGPVYVAHSAGPPRVVFLSAARRVPGSSCWAVEMIWVSRPSYDGPVLVRGRRGGSPWRVRIRLGDPAARGAATTGRKLARRDMSPAEDLVSKGWRATAVPIRIRAAADEPGGCYAFQVDGLNFSYVLPFGVQTR
jgi:hypothetical protein